MLNIGDYVVIQLHKHYDHYNYEYKLGEVVKVIPRLDVVSDAYYFSPPMATAHEAFAAERFISKLKRQGWRGEAGIIQNFRYLIKLPGGERKEIELSDAVQVPSFHVMCQITQCPESIQNRLLESMVTLCDINETDRTGNSILHSNNVLRNVELVRTLLLHGAHNLENICGLTPYEIAVLEGYSSSAAMIEKHCGKPDRSDFYRDRRKFCVIDSI